MPWKAKKTKHKHTHTHIYIKKHLFYIIKKVYTAEETDQIQHQRLHVTSVCMQHDIHHIYKKYISLLLTHQKAQDYSSKTGVQPFLFLYCKDAVPFSL